MKVAKKNIENTIEKYKHDNQTLKNATPFGTPADWPKL